MASLTTVNGVKQPTPRQKRFIDAYLSNGGKAAEALKAAGYKGNNASSIASGELRKPHVQDYLRRRAVELIGTQGVAQALHRMLSLAQGARSEYVQMQAAADIMNRAGFEAPKQVNVAHSGGVSFALDLGDDA